VGPGADHGACGWVFFSRRRRHRRCKCDWSSDVCSSDLSGHGCDDGCPLCCVAAQGDGWLNVPQLTAISAPQAVCTSVDWSGQMQIGRASCRERGEVGLVAVSGEVTTSYFGNSVRTWRHE